MTIENYFICFIGGMLGILAHIFFIKLPGLKTASKAANMPFSIRAYFEDDWISIASSVLTIAIAMYVLSEVVKWQPLVADWVKWFFVFIGYTGSSILQTAFGKTADKINQIVDCKTNELDAIKKQ